MAEGEAMRAAGAKAEAEATRAAKQTRAFMFK
jgi:hypothetical protein